jgi:hypothetical protein
VLVAGATMSFRYRLYLHLGDAAAGAVTEKYHDFINPPVAAPA